MLAREPDEAAEAKHVGRAEGGCVRYISTSKPLLACDGEECTTENMHEGKEVTLAVTR